MLKPYSIMNICTGPIYSTEIEHNGCDESTLVKKYYCTLI